MGDFAGSPPEEPPTTTIQITISDAGEVPGQLIDAAAAGRMKLIASLPLLDEPHSVLHRKKFAGHLAEQGTAAGVLFEGYAALVHLVVPMDIGRVILSDPG